MSGQLGLFDSAPAAAQRGEALPAAGAAREASIEQVDANALPEWRELARLAVLRVAEAMPTFTTDDVWEWLERNAPDVTPHEPAAMGPVIRYAIRAELCERTAATVTNSRRPQHHGELRIYRSLVFGRAVA